jgi:hypothetical protein
LLGCWLRRRTPIEGKSDPICLAEHAGQISQGSAGAGDHRQSFRSLRGGVPGRSMARLRPKIVSDSSLRDCSRSRVCALNFPAFLGTLEQSLSVRAERVPHANPALHLTGPALQFSETSSCLQPARQVCGGVRRVSVAGDWTATREPRGLPCIFSNDEEGAAYTPGMPHGHTGGSRSAQAGIGLAESRAK